MGGHLGALWHRVRSWLPAVKQFFHWKFSSVIIPVLLAMVMAMVGLASSFTGADYLFGWAYFFVFCCFVWSIGYWLSSDTLEKKTKRTRRQRRGLDSYSRGPYIRLLSLGCSVILALSFGTGMFVHGVSVRKRLQSFADVLTPGDKPTPPNPCDSLPPGALRILLGPGAAFTTMFPSNVIVIDGEPLLVMNKTGDGKITLSTDIYDRNHDIVAEIKDNQYDVDSSVYKMSRNSLSDLTVTIRRDKEQVLQVDYLNPSTISITGVFRTKNNELRVTPEDTYFDGRDLGHLGVCLGNNSGADFVFGTR